MLVLLAPEASGLRHLRWGREIHGSLEAHIAQGHLLSGAEREALRDESALLGELVQRLSGAVKPYRDFLERTRTPLRGRLRAGSFVCEQAARRAEEGLLPAKGAIGESAWAALFEQEADTPRARAVTLGEHRGVSARARRMAEGLRALAIATPTALALAEACEEAAVLLESCCEAFERMEEERRRPLQSAVRSAVSELRGGLARMNERLGARFSQAFIDGLYPEVTRAGALVLDESDMDDDASTPAESLDPRDPR